MTDWPLKERHCAASRRASDWVYSEQKAIKSSCGDFREPPPILTTFYRGTVESILTGCITVWYGNCRTAVRKALQSVVITVERFIGILLSFIQEILQRRCTRRASSIVQDSHPSQGLFALPSGRRLCSIKTRAARFCNSFLPPSCSTPEHPVSTHHIDTPPSPHPILWKPCTTTFYTGHCHLHSCHSSQYAL